MKRAIFRQKDRRVRSCFSLKSSKAEAQAIKAAVASHFHNNCLLRACGRKCSSKVFPWGFFHFPHEVQKCYERG